MQWVVGARAEGKTWRGCSTLSASNGSSSWQQFPLLALWLFCSPPSLFLSALPSPFRLFVSRKSLKLILIFDLCQTNLGARHQTAPNRANYINFHIVSCFDTHSKKKEKPKKETKKRKPNRKKSFCQTNEIRKSIILKPPKKLRAPFLLLKLGTLAKLRWRRRQAERK